MARFFSGLRRRYSAATVSTKVIYINAGVFIAVRLAGIVLTLCGVSPEALLRWVELPSDLWQLACRPWTALTYMWVHYDILHILFNMLFLYWFGYLFLGTHSPRHFVGLYILGGLGGAALYLLAYNTLPYFGGATGMMLGASASILAIVVAAAVRTPQLKIPLLLIGPVSLKWLAIATIFIDLISIGSSNAGGHIAHIGGAAVGLAFGLALRRGTDITRPINAIIDWMVNLFSRPKAVRVQWPKSATPKKKAPRAKAAKTQGQSASRQEKAEAEAEMDLILDKIKKSGYKALTADEKRRLFQASKKL